ncbi:MAG: hypothetical protein COA42_01650 [Alteromonadaceae bacterium]|nr:MAG: hypothetical protein COA42_01650 [Alteromonadaceae bacterium]
MQKHKFKHTLLSLALLLCSLTALATDKPNQTDFERYTVRHVIFNSTFILPEIARSYGIKRSKYESLINVSVSELGQSGGLAVKLSGTSRNLLQQQKVLEFIEIKEQGTTYYLAPIKISGEEILHLHLSVVPEGEQAPLEVKFSQKVYSD